MKKVLPVLYALPVVEALALPPRAEILPKIESGELEYLDVKIKAYRTGVNRNFLKFRDGDMPVFSKSFEGQPFQRDHDLSVDARDGTILESGMEGEWMLQTLRITTRRGMTDLVEGRIDRFSIGWFYDMIECSVCGLNWLECTHTPGNKYTVSGVSKLCELIFLNPKGKEVSSCIANAVEGTSVIERLQEYKLEVIGNPAVTRDAQSASSKLLTKGGQMKKKAKVKVIDPATQEISEVEGEIVEPTLQERQLEENLNAASELLGEQARLDAMDAQLQESHAVLVATCEHLLTTGLSGSRLPEIVQKRIRKQFEGRAFKAPELQSAIVEAREELAALDVGRISGPGRTTIGGMMDGLSEYRAALYDLFGLAREEEERKLKVRPLSGIREAYLLATGDNSFMGGYHPEFSLVTANFPGIVANIMNKMLLQAWKDFEQHYGWWKKIATVDHFTNLNDVAWIRTGTIASLPTVAERGDYQELPIGDNKETDAWEKFGGYIPLTIEAVLRDDIRAFRRMPREVALAGMRNISEQVAEIFTVNAGAGPTLSDAGALFNSTAVTTAGGHANLLTTALGTDYTAWNALSAAMFNQPLLVQNATGQYGTGKKQALDPSIILVPRALKNQAEALFLPRWEAQAQNVSPVSPSWGGRVEVVTVPEWTDATDYAAVVDKNLVPGVMIGEIFGVEPQIFSASNEIDPAMFANDESRIKVRQFLAVGVADFRPLHKSNVA